MANNVIRKLALIFTGVLLMQAPVKLTAQAPAFDFAAPNRTVDIKFVLVNGTAFAAAALDIASTRRCIDAGTCYEANPLMRCSAQCQYARAFTEVGIGTFASYELKKHGHNTEWWVVPTVLIGEHGVLAGMNMRF